MASELEKQIAMGEELVERAVETESDFAKAKNDRRSWHDYTFELLKRRFSNRSMAEEFLGAPMIIVGGGTMPLHIEVRNFRDETGRDLRALRSILGRLELIEEDAPSKATSLQRQPGSKVFLVHGHNERLREVVARLLERLDLDVVILHEQSSQGRTLIEKFEGTAVDVGFAVVIASADDRGGPVGSEELRPRARQNVIFEAGFFFGALGRGRTAILFEEGVELPSDIVGVVYIPLQGEWTIRLAKEIRAAGFTVDLNKL